MNELAATLAEDWLLRLSGILTATIIIIAAAHRALVWQISQTRNVIRDELAGKFEHIEHRLDALASSQEMHANEQLETARRVERLEHQMDDVLIPNQTSIARKLGAANRHDDEQ